MSDRKNDIQQTQSALRLLEALSGIDEELLERSDAPGALEAIAQRNEAEKVTRMSEIRKCRRIGVVYRSAVAACLGLVVVGALSWNALRPIWTPKGAGSSSNGSAGGQWELAENQGAYTTGVQAEEGIDATAEDRDTGAGTDEVTGDIIEDLIEDLTEDLETGGRDGGGADSSLTDCEDEMERLESANSENSSAQKESDGNIMSTAPPTLELTEEEARSTSVIGDFIPDDIPKGYSFESAYSDGQGAITIIWHSGMDSILINVSKVVPEAYETVDVDRTETYDIWLYEIPYGETVPSEYIETFQNPIFRWEDMSLEIVNSRMKSVGDAGDTDTPRGNFSVLYPEGVLLHFNGRGTAEEIWDMLSSVGK